MRKLIRLLKILDDNLLNLTLAAFIVFASLLPKIPIIFVEYTYIRIRYDDILPLILVGIFLIQLVRKKISLNRKFLFPILFFWVAVFVSFTIGYYLQNTIAVKNIGLLHSLRRIQYMSVFFVASSAVVSKRRFFQYLSIYFVTLLAVSLYGLGQRFLQFPSIQSMNPAYVDGRLLILNPADRINSTFGGHFDLAAYIGFSIPLLFAFYFFRNQKRYIALFVLSLTALLYTAARSSFIAYVGSISLFLLYLRKFRIYFVVILLTFVLFLATGEMSKRFLQTIQIKTVYINEKTGDMKIAQRYDSTKELPAGGFKIPLLKGKGIEADEEQLRLIALEKVLKESQGRKLNTQEIEKRAAEIAKYIKPQRTILCDIACSTRLQIEWPRAIAAFLYNPLLGTGPSSLTEATDNDFLRWLGELGLIGTLIFFYILISIIKLVRVTGNKLKDNKEKYVYQAFIFGVIALLINALYVDVFEASKVAYNFWIIAGLYVGAAK